MRLFTLATISILGLRANLVDVVPVRGSDAITVFQDQVRAGMAYPQDSVSRMLVQYALAPRILPMIPFDCGILDSRLLCR